MTVVITPGRRTATIRVRRLSESGDYSRAASDRANTVLKFLHQAPGNDIIVKGGI